MISIPSKPLTPTIQRVGMDLCEVFPNCECKTLTPIGEDSNCPNCPCYVYPGTYGGYLEDAAVICTNQGKYPIEVQVGDSSLSIPGACVKNPRTCYECYTIETCTNQGYYEDGTTCT